MTSDHVPDSPDELIRRAERAATSGAPPVTTRLPKFNFSMQDHSATSGLLDFTAVVNQLVLSSDGVPVVQMLHAATYLLAAAARGLVAALDETSKQTPPSAMFTAMSDLSQIEHCLKVLDSVTALVTTWHVNNQLDGDVSEQALHRCMVSRGTIDGLGLDPDAFDRYFFDLIKVKAYIQKQDD